MFGTPEIPSSPVTVLLDMEGCPDERFVYLIGVIIVEKGVEKRHSFWANSKEEEPRIFEQLLNIVDQHDSLLVLCYGQYDVSNIKRLRQTASKKKLVDKLLTCIFNVLSPIYSHFDFPTYSNSLKEIGRHLGSRWTEPDASGIQSLVWRAKWEATRKEEWKEALTVYNMEDCLALKKVVEFLLATQNKLACSSMPPEPCRNPSVEVDVTRVEEIEKLTNYNTWGDVNFANPDFDEINKCAYFDYQREKVYIRTSKKIRRAKAKRKKYGRAGLRVARLITITCSQCPFCHSTDLISGLKRDQTKCQVPLVKKSI